MRRRMGEVDKVRVGEKEGEGELKGVKRGERRLEKGWREDGERG